MPKTILILGGGMGGLVAANELRKRLSNEHKIILVDRSDSHFFYPSLLSVLEGTRTPKQIVKNFDLLSRKGIEFHQAEITKIDPTGRKVEAGGVSYFYDYLIISLGAELNYEAVPGITAENSLYGLSGILKLREQLQTFSGGKVFVVIAGIPFRCPAAPYEAAMILDNIFRKKGIRGKVDLGIFTAEDQPLPVAGPQIGAAVRKLIESQEIKYHPKMKLMSVDNQEKKLFFENGEKHDFNLLSIVPPHQSPEVTKAAGLLGESGWLPVNPETLETKYPGVFAIGDITGIKLANGKALPKAGVFAHFEAEVVASRIVEEIKGQKPLKEFKGGGLCYLETGGGKSGLAFGNFYAKPDPKVTMLPSMKFWHWTKILFEKWWLWKWF